MDRRRFLLGAVAAPFVITTPGLLMPIRDLWKPRSTADWIQLAGTDLDLSLPDGALLLLYQRYLEADGR